MMGSDRASAADAVTVPLILVVDDDQGTRETMQSGLTLSSLRVLTAASGAEAIALARLYHVDFLLVDLRLPDMVGTEIVKSLRGGAVRTPFALISGVLTVPDVIAAFRLGAQDVFEKPVDIQEIISSVHASLSARTAPLTSRRALGGLAAPRQEPRSVAERWAAHVLTLCDCDGDTKTIAEWSRIVGVSYSRLCETCRILGLRPHDARDFARMLRALLRARSQHCAPEALLDIGDRRTLLLMIRQAGSATLEEFRSQTIAAFFARQTFVPLDCEGLRVVEAALRQQAE